MKIDEIYIRDPYILDHEDTYYMYGTRAGTCWGKADGFDCYISQDLETWSGPHEIFKRSQDFWADQNFWAPECIYYRNKFYLITTFGDGQHKRIQILSSEKAMGPFKPISKEAITPKDWSCLDGTLFFEDEKPYLIFSHSFEDVPEGHMCIVQLSENLEKIASEIKVIFSAKDAPWTVPIPFAKKEFGIEGDVYFSDGPTCHRLSSGALVLTWSSWGEKGYTVGQAISESGKLSGPWEHLPEPVFSGNGGHGMLFENRKGELHYILHSPNDFYQEKPKILDVVEENRGLRFSKDNF